MLREGGRHVFFVNLGAIDKEPFVPEYDSINVTSDLKVLSFSLVKNIRDCVTAVNVLGKGQMRIVVIPRPRDDSSRLGPFHPRP